MRCLLFDTESTDLRAMMGRILCASYAWLRVDGSGRMSVGKPWTDAADGAVNDHELCVQVRDQLHEADCIVGWNSRLHDVPLLNARLAKWGEAGFEPHLHVDLMWYAGGSSMKIGSKKLDNVAKYFHLPVQKTPLDWDTWQLAGAGDGDALQQVIVHCEHDVRVLGEAYKHLIPYVKNVHR